MPEAGGPLRDVLHEKGKALFSGRIDVDTGGLAGVIHLSEGIVLDARLGTTTGEPALWRMLLSERARFGVEAGKPRATSGAVLGKADALLERFGERVVVLARYAEKVGGFDRVWALRFDALAHVLDELPDAINPVLRLLDGKRNVRQVVTECALDDMLALRILAKLLARGLLELPASSLAPQPAFEPVDVDEGLEAALAASLAEMEAEARDEPIPLTARAQPSSEPPSAPSAAPSAPTSTPPSPSPPAMSHAVPAAAALPQAPRVETNDDLRSWLGSEEAFFGAELRARPTSEPAPAARGIGVVPMVLLFVIAVGIGALVASSC